MEAPGMRRVLRAAWDQLAHAAAPPRTRTQAQPARMYLVPCHTPAALPRGSAPSSSPSPSPSSLPAARALLAWGAWRISGEGSGQVEARGTVAGRAVAGGGSAEGCGVGHDVRWRGVRQGGGDEAWARSRQWRVGGGAVMDAHVWPAQGVVQCTAARTSTLPALYLCVQAPASRPSSWLPPRLLSVIPAPWQELLEHPRTALHHIAWQYRDAAGMSAMGSSSQANHLLLPLSFCTFLCHVLCALPLASPAPPSPRAMATCPSSPARLSSIAGGGVLAQPLAAAAVRWGRVPVAAALGLLLPPRLALPHHAAQLPRPALPACLLHCRRCSGTPHLTPLLHHHPHHPHPPRPSLPLPPVHIPRSPPHSPFPSFSTLPPPSSPPPQAQGGAVRAHTSMSPAAAYRMAMCALNTHAGVLEVLGAPLLGAPVRAYVQGGGGIVLSGMAVRAAPRDCWLVFPVRGAEGRGVVQVHVHRHNGQYDLRLVAVDVAAGSAGSECVVVVGDHAALSRAQPLLQGLRHALDNAQGGRAGAETRAVENAQQEQG
ncbi:unnamed protein product [Closterium sp. Naga37s-1]|nr:unnamed protein product [Closterium sp. Naga37s-1]